MLDKSYYLIPHTPWFLVNFCHPSVSSNVTVAFFPLLLDINECTTSVHNCDVNAFCSNSEGSYNCTCSPGYTGNGTSCTGIYIICLLLKTKLTKPLMPVWIFTRSLAETEIYILRRSNADSMFAERVMEIEQGTFTPLVFTTTGGKANECVRYHSRLAELIANKKGESYSSAISWIIA